MIKKTMAVLFAAVTVAGVSAARNCDVREFGAKGDGVAKDTGAIQRAIDAVVESGGGTVTVSAGTYLSGSIFLKSNVDFYVAAGATIKGSPDAADYNKVDVCPQNSASAAESSSGAHLILCIEQKNVRLRGPGRIDGNSIEFIVDGNGATYPADKIPWRPSQMVYFVECDGVRVEDIELRNAPYWSSFYHGCTHVFIRGCLIENLRNPHTHNGDGIDIDCCEHVSISDCHIRTADDCITLRENGKRLKKKRPCRWVTVANSTLSSRCNAIRVGVGVGLVENAVFSNLVIENSRTAFNFVSSWGKPVPGVDIRNILVNNAWIDCEEFIHMYMNGATRARIENISFSNVSGKIRPISEMEKEHPNIFDSRLRIRSPNRGVVNIAGDPNRPIRNIHFSNINIDCPPGYKWVSKNVENVTRSDVNLPVEFSEK